MASRDDTQDTGHDEGGESEFRLDHEIARKYDPSSLSKLIMRDTGRGEPLDLHTRSRMERRLGGDFSNVRVIRGPLAEEVTNRYRADAVTVGGTELILVREGWQSNFQTAAGHALLAHELTHVQQSQRGLYFSGGDINSPEEVEAHHVHGMVQAEEEGRNMMEESTKRATVAWRKVCEEIHKEAKQMLKKEGEMGEIRDGSANLQSYTT